MSKKRKYSLIKRGDEIWWGELAKENDKTKIYSGAGGYQYLLDDDEVLETVLADDYDDLDIKKTSLYKYYLDNIDDEDRNCGFIDRKGKFYRCLYHEHSSLAYYLFDSDEEDLRNKGWIKILSSNRIKKGSYWVPLDSDSEINWITKEQIATLKKIKKLENRYTIELYEDILNKQK